MAKEDHSNSNSKGKVSHPGKVLYPQEGYTKADVADYYERIAAFMLPHIKDRGLTLKQFPQGIGEEGFYHKRAPDYFPEFIQRLSVPMQEDPDSIMEMVMVDEAKDLIYLAGQNTIELHIGLSMADALDRPDQMVFDLDPSDNDFEKIRKTALTLKDMLDQWQVVSFVKTSGSRGVHIHIPLQAKSNFEEVKQFARRIAEQLHQQLPGLTTLEHRKDKRGKKVFIDYLRNEHGMTIIAPYSLRARKHAPIATPITWKELKDNSLGPQTYTMANIFRRLSHQKGNPWKAFYDKTISLERLK